MTDLPRLHVWPSRMPPGWDGPQDDETAPFFESLPLLEALTQRYDSPAHFVCYGVPDGDGGYAGAGGNPGTGGNPGAGGTAGYETLCPRLTKNGAGHLTEDGAEPQMLVVAIDLDTHVAGAPDPHMPWDKGGYIPGLPPTPEGAVQRLTLLYPDAAAWATPRGCRLLWVLSRPVPVSHGDALVRWAASLVIGADERAGGWWRCHGLPRMTRDGKPVDLPMDISALTAGARLDPPLLAELQAEALRARPAAPVLDAEGPTERLTHVELDDLWACVSLTSKAGKLRRTLLAGEAYAQPGARNDTLHGVIRSLAFQLARHHNTRATDGLEAYELWLATAVYQMVRLSVENDTRAGAPTLDEAWSMAVRTAEVEASNVLETSPDLPAAVDARKESEAEDLPAIVYDQAGRSAFVCDLDGRYHGPVGKDVLAALCNHLRPDLVTASSKGVPHSFAHILRNYGTPARQVVFTHEAAQGYDERTQTLYVSTVTPPDIKPQHHPEIEHWLGLLFGSDLPRAEKWLAGLRRTDWPTCALYVEGPKGSGKGMLAAAVAQLWGSTPVPFAEAMARFNIGMARCPLVFLDEDSGKLDRKASGQFRTLIVEKHHTLEAKNAPTMQLRGHPRVLIAANNPDALGLTSGHTKEDVDAIAERLWHHKTDEAAKTYLDDLGAVYTRAAGWVTRADGSPGLIAEHIAHLELTVDTTPEGRLLVEGSDPTYHRRMVGKDERNAEVLHAVARALIANRPGNTPCEARTRPASEDPTTWVWVNASRLHAAWAGLVQEDQPKPTVTRVAAVVAGLSADANSTVMRMANGTRVRVWPIDPLLVLEKAEDLGLDGLDTLRVQLGMTPEGEDVQAADNRPEVDRAPVA